MEYIRNMFGGWLGVPTVMDPEELEDRVHMLEAKVETNRIAIEKHEADSQRHTGEHRDRG